MDVVRMNLVTLTFVVRPLSNDGRNTIGRTPYRINPRDATAVDPPIFAVLMKMEVFNSKGRGRVVAAKRKGTCLGCAISAS
jgi:hypothetical protein